MERKKRIEYLILMLCAFVSGVVVYGVAAFVSAKFGEDTGIALWAFPVLGGVFFMMLISGIMLMAKLLSKAPFAVKIIAVVLWPLTFVASYFVIFFGFLPYLIYNIVKLSQKDNTPPAVEQSPPVALQQGEGDTQPVCEEELPVSFASDAKNAQEDIE